MGCGNLWSDSREESRRSVDHELYRHDLLHLHPIPLSKIGRTTISYGDVGKRRFRRRCHHLHIRHALLVATSEQGDEEK
jgi:hypothetical protein